jgi:hypothetical protein
MTKKLQELTYEQKIYAKLLGIEIGKPIFVSLCRKEVIHANADTLITLQLIKESFKKAALFAHSDRFIKFKDNSDKISEVLGFDAKSLDTKDDSYFRIINHCHESLIHEVINGKEPDSNTKKERGDIISNIDSIYLKLFEFKLMHLTLSEAGKDESFMATIKKMANDFKSSNAHKAQENLNKNSGSSNSKSQQDSKKGSSFEDFFNEFFKNSNKGFGSSYNQGKQDSNKGFGSSSNQGKQDSNKNSGSSSNQRKQDSNKNSGSSNSYKKTKTKEEILKKAEKLFDDAFFKNQYKILKNVINKKFDNKAFDYFIKEGCKNGLDPNAYFKESEYLARHPEAQELKAAGECVFLHYVEHEAF